MTDTRYRWAAPGDLNAFFALFLDNVVNLVLLAGILIGFGVPADFIFTKMIPGTALGVMFGDLVYTWMAFRLAKKEKRSDVTAMPLGLDTPSTIGIAVAVLGPCFLVVSGDLRAQGMDPAMVKLKAAEITWYVGMGTMIIMGVVKLIASFFGEYVQRFVPVAGLLGSMAGIGIVWLAAWSLVEVYRVPFVGLLALGIIVFTLIARFDFPFKLPGAAMAVVVGTAIYYVLGGTGVLENLGVKFHTPTLKGIGWLPPLPESGAFKELGRAMNYAPVAIPFGLLTIVGGINVTEGARLAGDDYKTRDILLTEAVATLLAGVCGGVSQSTPYIGHSAYKAMGARAAYTLFTGLAVGIGGMLGLIGFIVELVPEAAVKPILIFVGIEITTLAFRVSPRRHAMAVVFAIIPTILNFGYTQVNLLLTQVKFGIGAVKGGIAKLGASGAALLPLADLDKMLRPDWSANFIILSALAQGYILTAMVWGAAVAFIVDRKIKQAAYAMFVAAVFSLFGMMHSVFPNGDLYLPWALEVTPMNGLVKRSLTIPYEFALAYIMVAFTLLGMYFMGPARHGQGPSEQIEEH